MKTDPARRIGDAAAPIVQLLDESGAHRAADAAAAAAGGDEGHALLARARAFAQPLIAGAHLASGEPTLAHADGVAAILATLGAAPPLHAAAWLVHAADHLARPDDAMAETFGDSLASLVAHARRLEQAQRNARDAHGAAGHADDAARIERVRKMLLAFSRDLRVVLLRLASRLQTLRWYAASKRPCPEAMARESLEVFAPLANRLGIWQIKWELEDLAFRFLQPAEYQRMARLLDAKRIEREQVVEAARVRLQSALAAGGVSAQVQGRPKHLYSIWKKMRDKGLAFEQVQDIRALRVIVADVPACYGALGRVQQLWPTLPEAYRDYIARPKSNGYQSLHAVAVDEGGGSIEIQIRTAAMHEHAESGVAAHWAYKEAGVRGYAGVAASGAFEERVAEARKAVLRQLLAWEREVGEALGEPPAAPKGEADTTRAHRDAPEALFGDRIYVFTPQAAIIELAAGATPVDFAYALHTELGHRCRGARVDGALVTLATPLASGQTVEIVAAKEGGPSLDWLNPELHFLHSTRARTKVRAWFNAQATGAVIARGRDAVEKLLQREGRTALKHDELAQQLGLRSAEALFEVVGKDELSLRTIEAQLRPTEPPADADALLAQRLQRAPMEVGHAAARKGGVLVVGVASLLTQLARCCKPAPPDAIGGYVTRGRGVAIHRSDCANFRQMARSAPVRVIPVAWDRSRGEAGGAAGGQARYPVDVIVEASDRPGLLRDLTELFAKERMNVLAVQTRLVKGSAWMTFTLEIDDARRLAPVLASACHVEGVVRARRR